MIICSKISTMTEGDVDRHHMVFDDDGNTLGQLGDLAVEKRAEFALNEQIQSRFAEKGESYADAFRAVMAAPKNKALVQCYAGLTLDRYAMERAAPDPDMTSLEASTETDTRARAYMHEHPGVSYQDATRIVLDADPELKATYASFQ